MNFDEFTFEKLFKSTDFMRYESPELRTALRNMNDFAEKNITREEDREKFEKVFGDCFISALDSGFEHGFRFAANLVKTLMKA